MYRILYDDRTLFDPYGDENEVVTDAKMTAEINAASYLDFTISSLHPLYDVVAEREGVVRLYSDGELLFEGVVDSIELDIEGNKSISCVSAIDYLNDTLVRPYSSVAGEQDLTCPATLEGYFQWLIDQHNEHCLSADKTFDVGVNQAANLKTNDYISVSSTSHPTTADEISGNLLDDLGGYLTMRYVDGRRVLDLYSDVHEMNAQIIDFGVNITDFTKTTKTEDQFTALVPQGAVPDVVGDFEDGGFLQWAVHPNTAISGISHGGNYSSYFTEGNGEYVNKTFYYCKKGARYRSTIWVRNERSSNITVYCGYQYMEAGEWKTATVPNNGVVAENKTDSDGNHQWQECTVDFTVDLETYTKIRPRWVFDNVGNDGNRRVYVDDCSFARLVGDQEVSEDATSLKPLPDGVSSVDSGMAISGDVVYSIDSVQRYGYREELWTDDSITDSEELLRAAVTKLNKVMEPKTGIEVKAVDLALYMPDYEHLKVGQAVRVRSKPHGIDEYLMVSSIDPLDLQDPGQTEYTLGFSYDTFTGKQSGFIRSLNAGIDSSMDSVAALDQTTKQQAQQIGSVENMAVMAQQTANVAKETADSNTKSIVDISSRQDEMGEKVDAATDSITSLKSDVDSEFQNVKDSVSDVRGDVDSALQQTSDISKDLESTKATVTQTVSDLGEVRTTATAASQTADQALSVGTAASQTAEKAQTTATSAYEDSQTALTQSSQATQTANQVSLDLKTNYRTKADADATYATQASLSATSTQIRTEVSETYATKATVNALENIANNAVQTWTGSGIPTLSNKPASDWTSNELKSQHSGDLYYDNDTGYSYRFGSSDGQTYSWSLIKDTDVTKALADAAHAQSTADDAKSGVTELTTTIPVTYATKTELTQKADSITSRVEEVAQAGTATSTKVTQLEQKADSIQSTVSQQGTTLDGAVQTISEVSQKADSLGTRLDGVSETADGAMSKSTSLEQDLSGFKTTVSDTYETKSAASTTYATKTEVQQTSDSLSVTISKAQTTADDAKSKAESAKSTADSASMNAANAQIDATQANNRAGNLETCIKMTSDGVRVGRIQNGEFTGYSALVNANGSFDILDDKGDTLMVLGSNGMTIRFENEGEWSSMNIGTDLYGNAYIGQTGGNGHPMYGISVNQAGAVELLSSQGLVTINGYLGVNMNTGSQTFQINGHDVRGKGIILFDNDANTSGTITIASGYKFSNFNYIMCCFKTNDNQYFMQPVYHPDGKLYVFTIAALGGSSDVWLDNANMYIKSALWKFSGNQAIRQSTKEWNKTANTVTVNDNVARLVAIIGFDYYSQTIGA